MTVQSFKNILKYSVASMFVKPTGKEEYPPINLLLIAPPECGKTKLLNEILCKKVLKTLDLSPKCIKDNILPKLQSNEIRFLIIPDLIQLLGHKKTTTGSTLGFLNALIEEGVKDSNFYGLEFHLPEIVNCGLITATTTTKFYENVYNWNSIGFLHRIIPVTYNYSPETINKIQAGISSGEIFKEINLVKDYKIEEPVEIEIPKEFSDDILLLVTRIVDRFSQFAVRTYKGSQTKHPHNILFDIKGFRLHTRLRQLTRAICFIEGKGRRKKVNSSDILKLKLLEKIINLPNTQKWL